MGRMKILGKDNNAGLAYLQKAKRNLNTVFTKQAFVDLLNSPDFDKVRNTKRFKKLME
jgi:hypothetical protein